MGYSGLEDEFAPLIWLCAILLAGGGGVHDGLAACVLAWGEGWFANRVEMAVGTLSKHPSGAHSLVPFVALAWGFAIAAFFTALMTVGGFGEDDDPLVPGMLQGWSVLGG